MAKNIYFKSGRLWVDDVQQPAISVLTFAKDMELYFVTGNARYASLVPVFDAMTRFFDGTATADDVESYQDLFDKLQDFYETSKDQALTLDSLSTHLDRALYMVKAEYVVPLSTVAPINLEQKVDDEYGLVSVGSNWKFTCRIPGVYQLSGLIGADSPGVREYYAAINGSTNFFMGDALAGSGLNTVLATLPIRLEADDTLSLDIQTFTDAATIKTYSWLSIVKLSN